MTSSIFLFRNRIQELLEFSNASHHIPEFRDFAEDHG